MRFILQPDTSYIQPEAAEQQHMIQKADYPLVLNAKHIIEILGVSKSTVYELFKDPTFPLLQVQGRKMVYRDQFFLWLDRQQRDGTGAVR